MNELNRLNVKDTILAKILNVPLDNTGLKPIEIYPGYLKRGLDVISLIHTKEKNGHFEPFDMVSYSEQHPDYTLDKLVNDRLYWFTTHAYGLGPSEMTFSIYAVRFLINEGSMFDFNLGENSDKYQDPMSITKLMKLNNQLE